MKIATKFAAVFSVLVLLPATAYAQAAITGVVRDTSGAVLPGVTVEAASPALIEKVRVVVSDGRGQYRVVDLRPGVYSVSFTLPGFNTVRRDGVELTGNFVATINAELRVGALEETITVTGETPIVDVQSARTQTTVSKDILAAIPTSRNVGGIQALIPGMNTNTDSGGISGTMTGGAGNIHGGRSNDSRIYADGVNMGWAGGSGGGGQTPLVSAAQEVVLTTSGGLGEAETAGVVVNVIPREGSNTFSGQFNITGSRGAWQGSNYTQALQDAGLRTPQELIKLYDVNPMGGGRIIRDKLWFYSTYRQTGSDRTVPGMLVNRNAGNINTYVVDFDPSQPAVTDRVDRQATLRLTWQASPRNKFNFHWSEQYNNYNDKGGGSSSTTIEATNRTLYQPSRQPQFGWSSPISSRLLAEAGWGMYQARYRFAPRTDGTTVVGMARFINSPSNNVANWSGGTLNSRMPTQFAHHLIGTLANTKASLSYITGAHSMKFGYQGGFSNPSQQYNELSGQVMDIYARNGVPYRIRQGIVAPANIKYTRNLHPHSFYAQDIWTYDRMTLQGGVRFDRYRSSYPASSVGGPGYPNAPFEISFAARSTPGYDWHDVTPRVGVAYDLFGNGKTALKFNIGKYVEAVTASNSDLDMNPLIRTVVSTTRGWNDANGDFVINCDLNNYEANGECRALDNANLGQPVFNRVFDLGMVQGWGTRAYNWTMGLTVQQEIVPRVSATVSYNRRDYGNHYTVDNVLTNRSDYTEYYVTAPLDPRLPGGGGYQVGPLYDINPDKQGEVSELATHTSNYAKVTENWHGVDVNIIARMRNGLTVQGGTSTGRKLDDTCAARAILPETYGPIGTNAATERNSLIDPWCRVVEPFRTQFKGLATYTIPRIDVQIAGTWASVPGGDLAANWRARNADVRPSLGRNLTEASSVSINILDPMTLFADRRNNIDFRVAKIFRLSGTRAQIGVDIYNLTNTDVVTSQSSTFTPGGSWLVPRGIQPARYAKISAQFDF